jgi:hypothetical protein
MPGPIHDARNKLLALFGKGKAEDPGDPYAMVGAPRKPPPPLRRSSIAQEPER